MKWGKGTLSILVGAVCALAVTLPGGAAHAAAPEEERPATLAALRAFHSAAGPGAAVHAGDSSGSWTLSSGTGTFGADRPIAADEHFRAGSQTKTFVATVVLQLAEEGRVSLDAPIEGYLPGVVTGNGHDGTRITVRQLLQHISGIGAYGPAPGIETPPAEPDGTYALAELVRHGLNRMPAVEPGTSFIYSNINYWILGMLVEELTGTPVHRAVTERVIEPLGLERTVFPAPGERALPEPAVNGYHGARVGPVQFWTPVISYDPSLFSSAAAMVSTLEDLTSFYRALTAGEILSPASLAEMRDVWPVGEAGYGLGLSRYRELSCGGTAWGHDGLLLGYMTYTLVTDDGRHASVVTNAYFQVNTPRAQLHALLDTALCESGADR
ncbi:serine hydrolase domain-containing protein [Streptomyces marincola]|uniref:Beta-lactamase-related domain-containing protein n=1 Tax=Streptomyces marincola TaxID=2878388 RepID=A0A1W7CWC4_9ACTN|nr:serine hydrolase domain-containing protein [Streptomyces marincola]ARQ69101.1 hypothetical protein CAG99_09720 [Streptomyces marincola]